MPRSMPTAISSGPASSATCVSEEQPHRGADPAQLRAQQRSRAAGGSRAASRDLVAVSMVVERSSAATPCHGCVIGATASASPASRRQLRQQRAVLGHARRAARSAVPTAVIRPSLSSATRSASSTVDGRWATTSAVVPCQHPAQRRLDLRPRCGRPAPTAGRRARAPRGPADHRAGQRQPLPLAAGQRQALLADPRVQPPGQRRRRSSACAISSARRTSSSPASRRAQRHVLPDRRGEQRRRPRTPSPRACAARPARRSRTSTPSSVIAAAGDVVAAGGPARSAWSCPTRSRRPAPSSRRADVQVDPAQHVGGGAGKPEAHRLQPNPPRTGCAGARGRAGSVTVEAVSRTSQYRWSRGGVAARQPAASRATPAASAGGQDGDRPETVPADSDPVGHLVAAQATSAASASSGSAMISAQRSASSPPWPARCRAARGPARGRPGWPGALAEGLEHPDAETDSSTVVARSPPGPAPAGRPAVASLEAPAQHHQRYRQITASAPSGGAITTRTATRSARSAC